MKHRGDKIFTASGELNHLPLIRYGLTYLEKPGNLREGAPGTIRRNAGIDAQMTYPRSSDVPRDDATKNEEGLPHGSVADLHEGGAGYQSPTPAARLSTDVNGNILIRSCRSTFDDQQNISVKSNQRRSKFLMLF